MVSTNDPEFFVATDLGGRPLVGPGRPLEVGARVTAANHIPWRDIRLFTGSTHVGEVLPPKSWPVRLFRVAGRPIAPAQQSDGSVYLGEFVVLAEVGADAALGPHGSKVLAVALTAGNMRLSESSITSLWTVGARGGDLDWLRASKAAEAALDRTHRHAARDVAAYILRTAALRAVRATGEPMAPRAYDGARRAAWDAATALTVRDQLSSKDLRNLSSAWALAFGSGWKARAPRQHQAPVRQLPAAPQPGTHATQEALAI